RCQPISAAIHRKVTESFFVLRFKIFKFFKVTLFSFQFGSSLHAQLLPVGEDVVSSVSMEMSPNTACSALLPWSLCLMFVLTSRCQRMVSAPLYGAPEQDNTTLLFDSGSSLRNCSCSATIQNCDVALANSCCRCHTVPRSALPRSGLRQPGGVTVWVRDLWVLEELLNSSMVFHLQLSFCGVKPLLSQQLVLLGLQTLRVHSDVPGAPYPNQEIRVSASAGTAVELDSSPSLHMTFVDVEVLNGLSALKAYSVIGPPLHTFSQFFPHLVFPFTQTSSDASDDPLESRENTSEPLQKTLITFVY
ncbi:hypothetical protein GOODEAATRI_001843, partial [Goodea atripinnis]